jgi:hypothetical protein
MIPRAVDVIRVHRRHQRLKIRRRKRRQAGSLPYDGNGGNRDGRPTHVNGRRMSALVSLAGVDIVFLMPALLKTNRYLRNARLRSQMITETARQSSIFEGARGLKARRQADVSSKRRVIASAKKSVNGS